MENVTLIAGAMPLPIQHCRNDTKEGEEGVWDGAHQMWGMFFFISNSRKLISFAFL
jgi:hypothetical protein